MKCFPALLVAAVALAAQDWRYELISPSGGAPQPRIDGTIAYDAATASLYLFGGQGEGNLNDLWAFALTTNTWKQLAPAGAPPPVRFGHTLVNDTKRNRLVLFGGQGRGFFSDVWAYDIAGNRWQQLAADNAGPSTRYGHSAVLDAATDRMIISHGFTNAGRFDDTWAFDLQTNQWRNLTPAGTKPLRRCLHHAVLDAAGRTMYLYGGCASGFGPCPLGDLWAFNLSSNTWAEVTPQARPAAREHYGVSFDTRRNRIVLNGGTGGGIFSDTWFFDPAARTWTQLPLSVPGPSARYRHQGAYAAERGLTYFFGGDTNGGASNELWVLSSGLATQPYLAQTGAVNAFSFTGGAVSPGEYISLFGDNLAPQPLVRVNGSPVEVIFAAGNQLNVRVPEDVRTGADAVIQATRGSETGEVRIPAVAAHPGLFPYAVNSDGTLNAASNPATAGSIATFYATGQGRNPASITLEFNGVAAELLYAAESPGAVGLLQVNARIPDGTASPAAVRLRVSGAEAQAGVVVHVR